jgi:uncharacterized protein (TIGR02391 family)
LTGKGLEAVVALSVLPPSGRAQEFADGLDELKKAVLDAVVEHELRVAGGAATRSNIRTRVRNRVAPKPEIADVNGAIETLVGGKYVRAAGGHEPSYQVLLRGLLGSNWGSNGLELLERIFVVLRNWKATDPELFRYSWGMVRRDCDLSHRYLNLTYITIANSGLGSGLIRSEGESWWATPPDLDMIVESPTALDYVRSLVAPPPSENVASRQEAPTKIGVPASENQASLIEEIRALVEPDAAPAVRAHQAFERLDLHPAILAACTKLFADGHYRNAALDAGVALVNYVQDKSGRRDLDGVSLMQEVFSPQNPVLAFNGRKTQSERNEQVGLMSIFVGAVQALRNPPAHGLNPVSAQDALEAMVIFSFLARRLDTATKRKRRKR